MAPSAVPRAYPQTERSRAIPHTPLQPDRRTGIVHLAWRFSKDHPLVVGAGWYSLRGGDTQADRRPNLGPRRMGPLRQEALEVIAEIVRQGSDGMPVLPGSSIKGAVRQVYELLTPSCQLIEKKACHVRPKDHAPEICPACSLFGTAGLGGRLAFTEARPALKDWRQQVGRTRTPMAWPPRKWVEGTVRVYDQKPATLRDRRSAPPEEHTFMVWGELRSSLRVVNASEEEMALLMAALGIGAPTPKIRIGGKKFHGLGAADLVLRGATWVHPARVEWTQEETALRADEWFARWVAQIPERKTAWEALHRALVASP